MDLRERLRVWMTRERKTNVDVASITKVDPKTVMNFLNGGRTIRIVEDAFARLIREESGKEAAS